MELNARIPSGPLEKKWDRHRFEMKLVNPANKRKYSVIVVGTGLGGGAAAATLGELGYNVKCFCFQDSPRRAHSIAVTGKHTISIDNTYSFVISIFLERTPCFEK